MLADLFDNSFPVFVLGLFMCNIVGTAFWIWAIIDCAKHEPDKGNNKLMWILIIVFTHSIGALIYYFARRPERLREQGH